MRRRYASTSSSKTRIFIRHDLSVLVMGEPMIPPAIEFWVCAGYAPDEFLAWVKTATLDDTGWVHKHNHFRKPWALIINRTDSRSVFFQRPMARDFGVCAGYALE